MIMSSPVGTPRPVVDTKPEAAVPETKPAEKKATGVKKVKNFVHTMFDSETFRQVAHFIGYIAIAVGSIYALKTIKSKFKGKKVDKLPADAVGKAFVREAAHQGKKYLNK